MEPDESHNVQAAGMKIHNHFSEGEGFRHIVTTS